jgi:hypothetical protein
MMNQLNEAGFNHHQFCDDRRRRNKKDRTVRHVNQPTLQHRDRAMMIGRISVSVKRLVQRLALSHCQQENEQAKQQDGGAPPGLPSGAQVVLCRILQGSVSSAETMHSDNRHLCKLLASEHLDTAALILTLRVGTVPHPSNEP